MLEYLKKAAEAYYNGKPFLTDDEFDYLAEKFEFNQLGASAQSDTVPHYQQMYSLQKVYEDEKDPFYNDDMIETPKIDGAAISLLYYKGILVQAATRGDGIRGQDITDKIFDSDIVPTRIDDEDMLQVTGEVATTSDTENWRNYASGALNLKDVEEFKKRRLWFIAYGTSIKQDKYVEQILYLAHLGFRIVLKDSDVIGFPTDGTVFRVNNSSKFEAMGFTSKHPKGAYARKDRADVAVEEAELLSVDWQVGKGGKVTPVANFTQVVIEDAKITRATLHNAGFVEDLDLHIGDTLLISRAGGVIPKVLGKL